MTAVELQHEFNQELRLNADAKRKDFFSYEVEYFLNKAQDLLIRRYYEAFERNEKARRAIANLINTGTGTGATTGSKTNGTIYTLPNDVLYILEEWTENAAGTVTKVKPIRRDEYQVNVDNPYKQPNSDLIWRMDYTLDGSNRRVELVTDGTVTISSYYLVYIKEPTAISISSDTECELDYMAEKELIQEAVKLSMITNKDTLGVELKQVETNKI